jgi:putative peptide zinc metalloprotease protein
MTEAFLSALWYRVASLRPQLRAHAQIHRHRYRGQAWYVLQDHASGRMHRFTPAAYMVIARMDGRRTIDAIWTEVAAELDEDAPTQDEVVQLLAQLHAADVVQCDTSPNAADLFERYRTQMKSGWKRNLFNPLSIKIPLWNSDAFLARTLPWVRPLIGRFGGILWLAVVLPAIVLAGMHWQELTENIGDRVLAAGNLLLIALTYPVVKALHELGHAYAVKVGGGEVHEIGLMMLVFFPVPYVDASAASAFRSKWQRAGVGAAGMLVEVFLAALALYVWLVMEPGLPRAVAFNVMLIAGISTVVFNGNPLLRFDGYYILADLIEIPNLAQRSLRYWGHLIDRSVLRTPDAKPFPASPGERLWFLAFGPASFAYRMLVLFGIVLFVAEELFVLGVVVAIWAVATSIVIPVAKMLHYLATNPHLRQNRSRAVAICGSTVATLIALAFFVPLPLHTAAEGIVWLPENAFVRAGTDGFVSRLLVEPGRAVRTGDGLIMSEEPTLVAETRLIAARVQALDKRLAAEMVSDRVQAEITRQELEKERAALTRAEERAGRLVAYSNADGIFVLPQPQDLPQRFFRQGEIIGYVTQPKAAIIRVVVSQDDIELVRSHLTGTEIKVPHRLAETFRAALVREVPAAADQLPSKALASEGGGRIVADPRDPHGTKALQRLFQLDLELAKPLSEVWFGGRVYVRFDHRWEPLAFQLYRRGRQLFLAHFNV